MSCRALSPTAGAPAPAINRVVGGAIVPPRLGMAAVVAATGALAVGAGSPLQAQPLPDLARQVEVRRTEYGVPHILAPTLAAAGFGMGYVQCEDYGVRVPMGLVRARAGLSMIYGPDSLDADFEAARDRERAVETYHLLPAEVRAVLEGFAEGVNHYVRLHRNELPPEIPDDFTGYDVAARDVTSYGGGAVRSFLRALERGEVPGAGAGLGEAREPTPGGPDRLAPASSGHPERGAELGGAGPPRPSEDGSNAWALAPSRTTSGHAILLRNPHLSWSAGYYEAQVTVPGVLNFYGDFRVGGPFGIIGGFNERLGWATTNNSPDVDQIYALRADPERPDHYLLDGASLPLRRIETTVEFRNGESVGRATRERFETALGPVIHRGGGWVYVIRSAADGRFRVPEQFLRMMRAASLDEWLDAMRMRARTSSNFTYADADGNIAYLWNAGLPSLPHEPVDDEVALVARRTSEVWTELVPFDRLPFLLNPPGGYLHNENDPPYFTNLHAVMDRDTLPPNMPEPEFDLRSQHAVELIGGGRVFSLEDVVEAKHSPRMLAADRLKDDLIAAVRTSGSGEDLAAAADLLERWDNTVAVESRGGVLFERWFWAYRGEVGASRMYREDWSPDRPTETPVGIADPSAAVAALGEAVTEVEERWGSIEVAWGEVHRVRRGSVDAPVAGCSGTLGCFRVLSYDDAPDGRRIANSGDGWVLAVEFGTRPRAYSILAYGQSDLEASPHFDDQALLFAEGRMKPVAFTEEEIAASLIRSYHPGEEAVRR